MDDAEQDLDLAEAAVHLGMSPMALAQLLDRGTVPSHLGRDGRRKCADTQDNRDFARSGSV